jgi:FtsP/CotA-like multicopper oxidase with cupredoxin domain
MKMKFGHTAAAALLLLASCAAHDATPPAPAVSAEAMVGGEVIASTATSVTLREARSRAEVTVVTESLPGPRIQVGECATFAGSWRREEFVAVRLQSTRPCS